MPEEPVFKKRHWKEEYKDFKNWTEEDWNKKIEERKVELEKDKAETEEIYQNVLKKWGDTPIFEPETKSDNVETEIIKEKNYGIKMSSMTEQDLDA